MSDTAAIFETLYAASDDPWGFRDRWYERRKRAIVCASLPSERYRSLWEIGCSNGELAAAMAGRADEMLAVDGNARAVELARQKLAAFPHVAVEEMLIPRRWPARRFDAIVLGEVGYYLTPEALEETGRKIVDTLDDGGIFVACHWRHPIAGCALTGDAVHRVLAAVLPVRSVVTHVEADFVLEIWSATAVSVAEREGLR